jgi:hypothetical protein
MFAMMLRGNQEIQAASLIIFVGNSSFLSEGNEDRSGVRVKQGPK